MNPRPNAPVRILALILAPFPLFGCATSYTDARSWEYAGNHRYLVTLTARPTNGLPNDPPEIERRLSLAAAEACYREENKNFEVLSKRDLQARESFKIAGYKTPPSNRPGFTAVVKCEGEPDPKMTQKLKEQIIQDNHGARAFPHRREYGEAAQSVIDHQAALQL